MVAGIFTRCQRTYKKMQKCKELRNFTQTTLQEVAPWNRVHMDHAYITGVVLLLILVDSFSIRVPDKKRSSIKHILRVIFSKNCIPKTLVSDNASEFCDEDLNLWLEKKGCQANKTPPYLPQSNGLAERMMQTVKMGLKACSQQKEKLEVCLPRLLLSYRTIPYAGKLESSSALMRRQIKAPLTISYSTNEKMWYKKTKNQIQNRQNLSCKKATIQL